MCAYMKIYFKSIYQKNENIAPRFRDVSLHLNSDFPSF